MPESKSGARARAARLGFPMSSVIKASKGGGYFIAPRGVTDIHAKHAYADCRAGGGQKSTCAAVAHNVQHHRGK